MGLFGTGPRLGAVFSAFLLGSFFSGVVRIGLMLLNVHRESLGLFGRRLSGGEGPDRTKDVNEFFEGLRSWRRWASIQLLIRWSWGWKGRGLGDEKMACWGTGSCVGEVRWGRGGCDWRVNGGRNEIQLCRIRI